MTLPFDMYFRFGGFTNPSQEYYGDFLEWSTSMRTANNHQPAGETHLARLRKRLDSWQQQIGKARRRRANQAQDDRECRWNGKLDFGTRNIRWPMVIAGTIARNNKTFERCCFERRLVLRLDSWPLTLDWGASPNPSGEVRKTQKWDDWAWKHSAVWLKAVLRHRLWKRLGAALDGWGWHTSNLSLRIWDSRNISL